MKLRSLFVLVAVLALAVAVSFSGGKKDTTKKTSSTKSECCMTEASVQKVADKSLPPGHPKVDGAKTSDECKDGDKAHCDMSKADKMSMKSSDGKTMDCCKDKAKEANAKTKAEPKSDGKGTN